MIDISQKYKSLYVSTDHRIKQIDLEMCSHRYDSCFRCVKDPYCGWDHDANSCKPYEPGLLQVRGFLYFSCAYNTYSTVLFCGCILKTICTLCIGVYIYIFFGQDEDNK